MVTDATIPTVTLPDGRTVPALGLGTWKMGERASARRAEVAAIRRARELGATPAQVALAWLLAPSPHGTGVIVIPKTASVARVEENVAAAALRLSAGQLAALDRAFPPPAGKVPLAMVWAWPCPGPVSAPVARRDVRPPPDAAR